MSDVVSVLSSIGVQSVAFLPNLISAIIILIIGLVLGKILGRVIKEVLVRIKLDYYVTETHKPIISLSNLFALVVRWWVYLAFIGAALSREILGIPALASWIGQITSFIPNIIGASAIVVVGYILGEYLKAQLMKTKQTYATLVGKVLFFFILYVAIALALPILGVPSALVSNILLIIIGSVGVGIAIALGLGLKDAVADISKRYAKKMKV
ncbi:MAG: hypothetical protein J4473_05890 [Candidatus Aenigmarchaeota archaeon]|nr:hypothetical protein [Candidatus Aenigmarchaeota archaeon]